MAKMMSGRKEYDYVERRFLLIPRTYQGQTYWLRWGEFRVVAKKVIIDGEVEIELFESFLGV